MNIPWTLPLLLAACLTARADIQWQATRLEFHPALSDKEVKGQFAFANDGNQPVTIDSVETGCGCTSATLAKKTYQPGEKGTIDVVFHIGERTGYQDKPIRVNIHGSKTPVVLTMDTYIPELMKMQPRYVFWRRGDPPRPQWIKLTASPGMKVTAVHAFSPNPKFKASIQTVHEGSFYLLTVTPVDTSGDGATTLAIEALAGPGNPKTLHAFATITPE
ncbi:MAG TPA: DUF1573 domain-containing protein [Chthoniobacteraceae bacterium]|jgi:hypothetical protein|nr:DUF1573 domain-containing protein [Chthoniobacteraceae bacterium]